MYESRPSFLDRQRPAPRRAHSKRDRWEDLPIEPDGPLTWRERLKYAVELALWVLIVAVAVGSVLVAAGAW